MARSQDFYTLLRKVDAVIWDAVNDGVALQREYVALDLGNTLPAGEGTNLGLTKTDVATFMNALDAFKAASETHKLIMSKLL